MTSCIEINIATIKNTPKNIVWVKYASVRKKIMYVKASTIWWKSLYLSNLFYHLQEVINLLDL